jgi:hypothetical protein
MDLPIPQQLGGAFRVYLQLWAITTYFSQASSKLIGGRSSLGE